MPIPISYMGTKKQLAPKVAELVSSAPDGPFLDLFSGMCAVGEAVSPMRQVWSNDLQTFASKVAEAHFCSMTLPPSRTDIASRMRKRLSSIRDIKLRASSCELKMEQRALSAGCEIRLREIYEEWSAEDLDSGGPKFGLFERNFAGSYFGRSQSIEIDAIRQTLDEAVTDGEISENTQLWLLLALAVAVGQCATVTGHFAQPLTPNSRNVKRFINQRIKGVTEHWLSAIEKLRPIRDASWRRKNRVFNCDANSFIKRVENRYVNMPSVVYADPPYTSDHYSRYYHLYETLMLYDYPAAVGKGRYREDRTPSNFSIKTKLESAMNDLFSCVANIDAMLILSYPTNGLLENSCDRIPEMMKVHFGSFPEVSKIEHRHSTMGASKGQGKANVTEVLYRIVPK